MGARKPELSVARLCTHRPGQGDRCHYSGADRAGGGREPIAKLHERLVKMAQEQGVVKGRKMRVDTTVVETTTHYPTDSKLLGDGARGLTRRMKDRSQERKARTAGRDRMRSVNKRVIAITTAGRYKGEAGEQKR